MGTFQLNWSDRQKFCFICGFRAALTVKDLNAPMFRMDSILFPIGIGGPNERAIIVANTQYDGDGRYLIPVYTWMMRYDHPMRNFSGFTARIDISDSRIGFNGITAGDNFDPSSNMTYQVLSGNQLLVQGLTPADYIDRQSGDPVAFDLNDLKTYGPLLYSTSSDAPQGFIGEFEILFYLDVNITGGVTSSTPIRLNLIYRDGTVTDQPPNVNTSLITFISGADALGMGLNPFDYYMFFVTPILASGGSILSDVPINTGAIGGQPPISSGASPSCVYSLPVLTPPDYPAVAGLYLNLSYDDVTAGNITSVTSTWRIGPEASGKSWAMFGFSFIPTRGYEYTEATISDVVNGVALMTVNVQVSEDDYTLRGDLFGAIKASITVNADSYSIPIQPLTATINYE